MEEEGGKVNCGSEAQASQTHAHLTQEFSSFTVSVRETSENLCLLEIRNSLKITYNQELACYISTFFYLCKFKAVQWLKYDAKFSVFME